MTGAESNILDPLLKAMNEARWASMQGEDFVREERLRDSISNLINPEDLPGGEEGMTCRYCLKPIPRGPLDLCDACPERMIAE